MDDFEAEMVAATQQAERTQQLCSRKRAAPAARALQPLNRPRITGGGGAAAASTGDALAAAPAASHGASGGASGGGSVDDSSDDDSSDDDGSPRRRWVPVRSTKAVMEERAAAKARKAAAAEAAPMAAAASARIMQAADTTRSSDVQQRAQPQPGEIWGRRAGAVFAVVSAADGRHVHAVRLYRHTETFVSPYVQSCGLTRDLVASDKHRKVPMAEFLLGNDRLGVLREDSDGRAVDVPIVLRHVYHKRFPVGFRTSPLPSTVLGVHAPRERDSAWLGVRCASREVAAFLMPEPRTDAELVPPRAVLSQADGSCNCSQDDQAAAGGERDDGEGDEQHDLDPEEWSERVLLSQASQRGAAAAAAAAVSDDDEDEDEDEDEEDDDDQSLAAHVNDKYAPSPRSSTGAAAGAAAAAVARPPSQKLLALELYAGCGGLSHIAGTSHGVEISAAWSVECMPEAAATNRANHPMCKVLEITAEGLRQQVEQWIKARDAWLRLSPKKQRAQRATTVPVRDHQIMKTNHLTAGAGAASSGASGGGGGGGAGGSLSEDDDDDDFACVEPWNLLEILDFQAVTRPHKLEPLGKKNTGKEIWVEYKCRLRRGGTNSIQWVELTKR